MANVLLTTRCNLKCPYCFAQERLSDGHKLTMPMSNVEKVVDFLKRSGHPYFRLMGGEPTLHPEFPVIVQKGLEAGMRVDVLSNATWPENYNSEFQRISPRRLFFLLNIDHPDRYLPKIWERIERNLTAVCERGSVTLSFNIFETEPRYEYILRLTEQYRIDKVRMSFSLPVVGATNAYLKLEDYKAMAPFVVEFVRRAEQHGVQVRMDNAVPLCMFTYEQAGELLLKGAVDLQRNLHCEPVIDIGPDLSVWCCFCLSKMWNRHLDDFNNLEEMLAYYRKAMGLYQSRLYPMDECYECRYRELWACQGGCLTHAVMKHGELSLEDPEALSSDCWKPGAVLALSADAEIRRYENPEISYAVYNKVSGLELEVDASYEGLLQALNGRYSAGQVIDRFIGESTPNSQSPGPLEQLTHDALAQGANELLLGLLQQGFLEQRPIQSAA